MGSWPCRGLKWIEKNSDMDMLVDQGNVLGRLVILKFDCASESPRKLLKPWTAGPTPVSDSVSLGDRAWKLECLMSYQDADAAGSRDSILRTIVLDFSKIHSQTPFGWVQLCILNTEMWWFSSALKDPGMWGARRGPEQQLGQAEHPAKRFVMQMIYWCSAGSRRDFNMVSQIEFITWQLALN